MFGPIAVPEPARVPRSVFAGLAALAALAGHAGLIAAAVYATVGGRAVRVLIRQPIEFRLRQK